MLTLNLRSLAITRIRFPFLLAVSVLVPKAFAETVEALPIRAPGAFNESFDDFPKTSTNSVVGVALGVYDGMLHENSIRLANPPQSVASEHTVCLATVTQDARFLADNPFRRRALLTESLLLAAPITQSYEDQLAAYGNTEIAIRAVLAEDEGCYRPTQVFLPQLGSTDSETLTVLINSRNRDGVMTLSNKATGQEIPEIHCEPAGAGSRVAYDLRCQYDISNSLRGTLADVRVELDDGFGIEPIAFKVFIPSDPSLLE